MSKVEELFNAQPNESKSSTLRRRFVLYVTVGTLVSAMAFSAIAAIACQNEAESLPSSAPQIATTCNLPDDRSLYISVGGLEPIPDRQIHALEIFSFPNDGKLPVDDVHIQIWWETTNGLLSFPQDLPPIIQIGR
jgi:hypothetical protein